MELFNYEDGQLSIGRQTYEAIRNSVDFSYDEFMMMSDNERSEWIDACRLALLLIEEKGELLYKGYCNTNMFDLYGNFNLGNATCIIRRKKKVLDIIEKDTNIEFTPAQFVLLGESGTQEVVNDSLKVINQEIAKSIDERKVNEYIQTRNEIERLVLDEDEIL